jgi:hypothetical protein
MAEANSPVFVKASAEFNCAPGIAGNRRSQFLRTLFHDKLRPDFAQEFGAVRNL